LVAAATIAGFIAGHFLRINLKSDKSVFQVQTTRDTTLAAPAAIPDIKIIIQEASSTYVALQIRFAFCTSAAMQLHG